MLLRLCWHAAACDPNLVDSAAVRDRALLALVGVGTVLQTLVAGYGAAGGVHLASPHRDALLGDLRALVIGGVLALFWLSIARLMLVTSGERPAGPLVRRFRWHQRLVVAALVMGLLGGCFAGALVVSVAQQTGLLVLAEGEGLLSAIGRAAAPLKAAGVPLALLFVLPLLLREYVAQTRAEHGYDSQAAACAGRIVDDEAAATEAAMTAALRTWAPAWRLDAASARALRWSAEDA